MITGRKAPPPPPPPPVDVAATKAAFETSIAQMHTGVATLQREALALHKKKDKNGALACMRKIAALQQRIQQKQKFVLTLDQQGGQLETMRDNAMMVAATRAHATQIKQLKTELGSFDDIDDLVGEFEELTTEIQEITDAVNAIGDNMAHAADMPDDDALLQQLDDMEETDTMATLDTVHVPAGFNNVVGAAATTQPRQQQPQPQQQPAVSVDWM